MVFPVPWLELHGLELLPLDEAIAIFLGRKPRPPISLDVRVSHVVERALSQNLNPDTPPLDQIDQRRSFAELRG